MNPYRKYRRRKSDYVIVAVAMVAVVALLGWALVG
jgi:hypothetical protein